MASAPRSGLKVQPLIPEATDSRWVIRAKVSAVVCHQFLAINNLVRSICGSVDLLDKSRAARSSVGTSGERSQSHRQPGFARSPRPSAIWLPREPVYAFLQCPYAPSCQRLGGQSQGNQRFVLRNALAAEFALCRFLRIDLHGPNPSAGTSFRKIDIRQVHF